MSPRTLTQLSILLLIDLLSANSIADDIENPIATTYDTTDTQYGISIFISFQFQTNIHKIISYDITDILINVTQWIMNEEIDDNNVAAYCMGSINTINATFTENTNNASSVDLSTVLYLCEYGIQQSLSSDFRSNLQGQLIDILGNNTLMITPNSIDLNITTFYITSFLTTQSTFNDTFLYYISDKEDHTLGIALMFGIAGGALIGIMIFTMVKQINMYRRVKAMESKMYAVQPQLLIKANKMLGLGMTRSFMDLNAKSFRSNHKAAAIGKINELERTWSAPNLLKDRSRSGVMPISIPGLLTDRSKSRVIPLKDRSTRVLNLRIGIPIDINCANMNVEEEGPM